MAAELGRQRCCPNGWQVRCPLPGSERHRLQLGKMAVERATCATTVLQLSTAALLPVCLKTLSCPLELQHRTNDARML